MTSKTAALGIFDGVHIGHRKVLEDTDIAVTFAGVSQKRGEPFYYIYDDEHRARLLKNLGVREVVALDFERFRGYSPQDFVEYLIRAYDFRKIKVGADYRFGKNARGTVRDLEVLCAEKHVSVDIIEPVLSGGTVCAEVSSSRIRRFLKDGEIENANALLGESYTISGEVMHGKKLGRTLNFPTANQHFGKGQLVPRYGVYAGFTELNGKGTRCVTNIGVRPTVGGDDKIPIAETHILDYYGELYGDKIYVKLTDFIRPEQRFADIDELKRAMEKDRRFAIDNPRLRRI